MHEVSKGRPDKAAPDSDATSKDKVEDVTENEADSSADKTHPAPSPDGSFDESGKSNDAGPM